MSDERKMSDELGDDLQTTKQAMQSIARAPKQIKQTVQDTKKAVQTTKKVAKKANKATKKVAKATQKATKAAAKATGKLIKAIGHLIAVTFPWSLIVILVIILIIMIFYMVTNSTIFNVLTKIFQEPTVDDIREYITNTQTDEKDWRFYYNKMLPEEQYEYIYFGNHKDNTAEGNDIKGLADYIIEAYEEARKAFEQDLGDIEAYHNEYFGKGSTITATIDDIDPLTWTKDQIDSYLQTQPKSIKVVGEHEDWYESGHTTKSGVYVRSRIQNYIEKLQNQTGGNYKGGYFDYLEFEDLEESEEGEDKKEELILKRRLVLNLDLTYLANHDTLVGDLIQATDGKIYKDSDLTNVVTYLIAGMNVATCDISPSKGYLDFLEKTIGNPDVWDPAVKYQGNVNLSGVLGAIIHGAEEMRAYSLFTTAKVKFKDQNGKNRKEKMGILDTTACEVVPLEACDPGYVGKYGEPVREYYIVMKNPIDTDRLLWAMFVSDAGKTVTYEGIFNSVTQAYQGSYYDMYCIFEPINAAIHENFYTRFFAAITGTSAAKTNSIAFAQYADAEQVRKYLYGLNQEEVENNDQYFHELWDNFEGDFGIMGKYKDMLTDYYLVDKDGSKTIDCDDFTGILNETYFTYHMRPLYKCDANLDITTKHNLAHDGYGVSSMDGSSGSETPSADGGDSGGDYLERCLLHKIFPHDFGYENCEACLRKNGGYECDCEDGGINCVEWASDWPPECPDCKEFAQRALHGKIKVEYVRDPKPEFATLISITEDEYYTKILGENPPGEDIGATLAAIEGNKKVDLTTNYNRYGYGDNYDPSIGEAEMSAAATPAEGATASEPASSESSETSDEGNTYKVVVPPEDAFHETGSTGDDGKPKKKYFFSVYEFYGEYATAESWETVESTPQNFHLGNADLIEMDPKGSKLEDFKSKQEISEEYNRAMYNKWAEAVKEGNGANAPANYRAVSVLSALYKRKYYYHNLLNTDSLDAGMYDEKNGYERPVATYFYDPENPDTAKYSESYEYDGDGNLVKTEDTTTAEVTPSNVKASGMSLGTVGVLTASVTVNTDSDVLSAEGPDDSSKSSGGSSYANEFDKEFTSRDKRDTAFYGRPMKENESVDLDKKDTDKENFMDDPIEITKDDGTNSWFKCPGTEHYVAVPDDKLMQLADDGIPFYVYCYEHNPVLVFIVCEGPEIYFYGTLAEDGTTIIPASEDMGGSPSTGGGGGSPSPGTGGSPTGGGGGGGGGSSSPAPGTGGSSSVDDSTFFAEHANTSNSISGSLPSTYYNQTDGTEETDRCMQTSVATMVDIATGGDHSVTRTDVDYDSGYVTVDGKTYYRQNATTYSSSNTGYTNYTPSDGDEWQKIIMSEIDAGRAVVVHTTFINTEGEVSQHWVTVTGYTTDASGKIPDMSHLSGYDPWGGAYTSNLGTNTGVSHNGQGVHSDMRVETFNPN